MATPYILRAGIYTVANALGVHCRLTPSQTLTMEEHAMQNDKDV